MIKNSAAVFAGNNFHINNFIKGTYVVSKKKLPKNITEVSPSFISAIKNLMHQNNLKNHQKEIKRKILDKEILINNTRMIFH